MFSKPLDQRLKSHIYDHLRPDPESGVRKLRSEFMARLRDADFEYIKDVLRVLKFLIKDAIPAKPKFYGLLLIKCIMERAQRPVVEFFMKKLMSRLFLIAQFEMKVEDRQKGTRCLKKYYNQNSQENSDFSFKFYTLLLECWKHWDQLFSQEHKKIKVNCDKLRTIFPVNDYHYNDLEADEEGEERGGRLTTGHRDTVGTRGTRGEGVEGYEGIDGGGIGEGGSMAGSRRSADTIDRNLMLRSLSRDDLVTVQVSSSLRIRKGVCRLIKNADEGAIIKSLNDLHQQLTTQGGIMKRLAKSETLKFTDDSDRQKLAREIDVIDEMVLIIEKAADQRMTVKEFKTQMCQYDQGSISIPETYKSGPLPAGGYLGGLNPTPSVSLTHSSITPSQKGGSGAKAKPGFPPTFGSLGQSKDAPEDVPLGHDPFDIHGVPATRLTFEDSRKNKPRSVEPVDRAGIFSLPRATSANQYHRTNDDIMEESDEDEYSHHPLTWKENHSVDTFEERHKRGHMSNGDLANRPNGESLRSILSKKQIGEAPDEFIPSASKDGGFKNGDSFNPFFPSYDSKARDKDTSSFFKKDKENKNQKEDFGYSPREMEGGQILTSVLVGSAQTLGSQSGATPKLNQAPRTRTPQLPSAPSTGPNSTKAFEDFKSSAPLPPAVTPQPPQNNNFNFGWGQDAAGPADNPFNAFTEFNHGNMEMIVEDSKEDFDESRRSQSKVWDPKSTARLAKKGNESRRHTEERFDGNNSRLKFDDFYDLDGNSNRESRDFNPWEGGGGDSLQPVPHWLSPGVQFQPDLRPFHQT